MSDVTEEDMSFFTTILQDYDIYIFPFFPVITAAEASDALANMHLHGEARAFVYALCATTLSLAHSFNMPEADEMATILRCLTKSVAALPGLLCTQDITVRRVVLTDFIHVSLHNVGRFEAAYHYLRQCVSMVESLQLEQLTTYEHLTLMHRTRLQRLYYLIFVHERYFAFFRHHQITLTATLWRPEADDTLPRHVVQGFNQIIGLFLHVDMNMINAWRAITDDAITIDPDWIRDKHREFEDETTGSVELAELWPMQRADLIVTKQWMRMLLWQIALSRHLLSTSLNEQGMSLLFPVGVSMQLRTLIEQVSKEAISIHGVGIQQKLFELTDVMASVVLTVPNVEVAELRQRIDDFRFLFGFWRALPRLNTTHLSILQEKDGKINDLQLRNRH